MSMKIRFLRWIIADRLCRVANLLRGHESRKLGYDIYGNEAAEIEDRIHMALVCSSRLLLELNEVNDLRADIHKLAQLARYTWWHDPQREQAERDLTHGQKGEG